MAGKNTIVKPYEIFTGEELRIAELIQRRRLQLLVHSYIYYERDDNIVPDKTWSEWAKELEILQKEYPEIEVKVPYRDGFENWDASTGAFLPYKTNHIRRTTALLFGKLPKPRIYKNSENSKKLGHQKSLL